MVGNALNDEGYIFTMDSRRLQVALAELNKDVQTAVTKVFKEGSREFLEYVIVKHLSGPSTGEQTLRRRSGMLSNTTREHFDVRETPFVVQSGISFGVRYAIAHVGAKGSTYTIKPKKGKALAVPLKAAQTPSGVTKQSASQYPPGFLWKMDRGGGKPPLLVHNEGKRMVPYFVLLKSVTIKRRIWPKELAEWYVERLIPKLEEGLRPVVRKISQQG